MGEFNHDAVGPGCDGQACLNIVLIGNIALVCAKLASLAMMHLELFSVSPFSIFPCSGRASLFRGSSNILRSLDCRPTSPPWVSEPFVAPEMSRQTDWILMKL